MGRRKSYSLLELVYIAVGVFTFFSLLGLLRDHPWAIISMLIAVPTAFLMVRHLDQKPRFEKASVLATPSH